MGRLILKATPEKTRGRGLAASWVRKDADDRDPTWFKE
jgi:hypothetical protein